MEKPQRKLKLYKALKIGYLRNEKKQQKALKRFGYQIDTNLSDGRERVIAFNPQTKKVLFIENGTDPKNLKDLETDVVLAFGGIKQTKRYEDSKNALLKAHEKYKDAQFILTGHSLGAGILNYNAKSNDQVVNYNPAYSIGNHKVRDNIQNYRTEGDIISSMAPNKNTTLLKPIQEEEKKTKINGEIITEVVERPNDLLSRHELENIKNLPVYL
jgi:hypothetical protein